MKPHLQGNRLLDGLLVSCLIHLLVLVYAESGAETWMAQGPHASSDLSAAAPNDATCCVVVRLVMQQPPPSVPIEHTPGALLPLIPKITASEPTPPKEAAANKTAASGMPLLPVAAPLKQTVYFYDRSELNVFPVLETPVHFDIESLPIDDVGLGHADIMIYIQDDGQVVQLQVEFSSLSAPTLRLVSGALMKARFTPGRVSGDAVPARIRWRVVMESASSFTMMN